MPGIGSNQRPGQALAVVVGGGGMGLAVARRLGARHRVLLADRDPEHLERTVAALRVEGHDAFGCPCDVADPAAVAELARAAGQLGPMRVLAHVVGLSPSMAGWQRVMAVNWVGASLVAEAMLPLAGQGTAAVFIASIAGHSDVGSPEVAAIMQQPLAPDFMQRLEVALGDTATSTLAYQLSKRWLIAMCRERAAAWGERGARIVSVSPGLIATPMGALEFKAQPAKHALLGLTPLGREGTSVEIADAVDFLASDRASFITGTDLLVDGGLVAALAPKG